MLIFTSLLAFYLAWNLGANDVANSMGTSVGSKAVTLRQALIVAGVLEFAGAVLFGRNVSATLATKIVNPALFVQSPQLLLVGMVSVLLACGIWLNIATWKGLPVSSSHAVVGAIAGFACVAISPQAVAWRSIGIISLSWVVTPVISGAIAALFYSQIKRWILDQTDTETQLREWIPWLSVALLSSFGVIVLPTVVQRFTTVLFPSHTVALAIGAVGAIGLTFFGWNRLEQATAEAQTRRETELDPLVSDRLYLTPHPTPHTPYSSPLTPHPSPIESVMGRFQLVSACFVAFAHGSNDVGNAVAPLAAIVYITETGMVPLEHFQVPLWILVLGGAGIVCGLAVWGKRVMATIGEDILSLQPSGGFCAELATATTVLLASSLGLPVSTSHALVGGVVGIGMVQAAKALQWQTLRSIGVAWIATVPLTAGLSALIFTLGRWVWLR